MPSEIDRELNPEGLPKVLQVEMDPKYLGVLLSAGQTIAAQIRREGGAKTEPERLLIEAVEKLEAVWGEHLQVEP